MLDKPKDFPKDFPKVSLVMPTYNRTHLNKTAIHCYLQQTYPWVELIIVDDSDDGKELSLPYYGTIKTIKLDKRTSTGTKRNIGADAASGDIIANWDDDDFSSAHRIEDEVQRLSKTGKAVTGYNKTVVYDTETDSFYRNEGGPPYFASGTSQCYWKAWWKKHPYPDCSYGEDSVFAREARLADELACANPGNMLVARKHATNTEFVNLRWIHKLDSYVAPMGFYEALSVKGWISAHFCYPECEAEAKKQFEEPMIEYHVSELPEVVTR